MFILLSLIWPFTKYIKLYFKPWQNSFILNTGKRRIFWTRRSYRSTYMCGCVFIQKYIREIAHKKLFLYSFKLMLHPISEMYFLEEQQSCFFFLRTVALRQIAVI